MTFSLGIVGAGQFSGQFSKLFNAHPLVGDIYVTDVLPERASTLVLRQDLAGTLPSFEAMLESDLDAVAIFTQRWTHGPLVVQALRAGKHVYSAVPMAVTEDEIRKYFDEKFASELPPDQREADFSELHAKIEEVLTQAGVDRELDAWLKDQGLRTKVEYVDKDLMEPDSK